MHRTITGKIGCPPGPGKTKAGRAQWARPASLLLCGDHLT